MGWVSGFKFLATAPDEETAQCIRLVYLEMRDGGTAAVLTMLAGHLDDGHYKADISDACSDECAEPPSFLEPNQSFLTMLCLLLTDDNLSPEVALRQLVECIFFYIR